MALHLKIITPRKVVVDDQVDRVTAPAADGEITVLPHHAHLLTLLQEGIVTLHKGTSADHLAIGGGYLETEGKEVTILVSRAYKQDEIDEQSTQQAIDEAKKVLSSSKDQKEILEANTIIRRSTVDLKLIRRRKRI